MKVRYCFYVTVLVLLGITCFGISKRGTYTDVSSDGAYLETIHVAQIPEEICVSECELLAEELPLASEVVKVTALADVEHLAGTSRQLVRVQDVYQGTALEEGQEIYVTFYRWSLSLSHEPFSVERSFVNIMETGEEYLLFLEGKADALGGKVPVYRLYGGDGERVVAPVFAYKEHENRIADDMVPESTYVRYGEVRENEFFAMTHPAMDALVELKGKMMEMYPE